MTAKESSAAAPSAAGAGTFGADAAFLEAHTDAFVLADSTGLGRVAVVPAYQGRVMTSTAGGDAGASYGWVNRALIASGEPQEHIHVFGGEDRFWLGPEGGQFSVFFKEGDPFDLAHWQTPAVIDTEPFELVSRDGRRALFRREAELTNYSGTRLAFRVEREVAVLEPSAYAGLLGAAPAPGLRGVAFETNNRLTNTGEAAWTRETGMLSIWILGMFKPAPGTTVVIPYLTVIESEPSAPPVNDDYFGKVPADRLRLTGTHAFFRGDGQYRSKIGLSPRRSTPVLGSYDEGARLLTIVQFNQPPPAVQDYVNSAWEIQEDPFAGDVINSYNDGPPEPGKAPLGPFYELETSSPAAALEPGASLLHTHRTFHFEGDEAGLDALARAVLGVSLQTIADAF